MPNLRSPPTLLRYSKMHKNAFFAVKVYTPLEEVNKYFILEQNILPIVLRNKKVILENILSPKNLVVSLRKLQFFHLHFKTLKIKYFLYVVKKI